MSLATQALPATISTQSFPPCQMKRFDLRPRDFGFPMPQATCYFKSFECPLFPREACTHQFAQRTSIWKLVVCRLSGTCSPMHRLGSGLPARWQSKLLSNFPLLFPLLVLKGIYRYRKFIYFSIGAKGKWRVKESRPEMSGMGPNPCTTDGGPAKPKAVKPKGSKRPPLCCQNKL